MRTLAIGIALTAAAVTLAPPPASAELWPGNYNFIIPPDRRDFHTWRGGGRPLPPRRDRIFFADLRPRLGQPPCRSPRPTPWYGIATLNNGQYTMTVDNPDGLRCGDIYYGPVIPTRDVFTWDAKTVGNHGIVVRRRLRRRTGWDVHLPVLADPALSQPVISAPY